MHPDSDNLFFALHPQPDAAAELSAARDWLAEPATTRISTPRLHLTLLLIAHRAPIRMLGESARSVLEAIVLPACRVMFDRLIGGRRSAFVCPSESLRGLDRMQAALASELAMAGIFPPKWWRFRPHVTLLYGVQPFTAAIDPIGWHAQELVLIRSHVGRTHHETIGRWTLR